MQFSSPTTVSPSFTGNSSNNLADIAARVIQELHTENGHTDDFYNFSDDGDRVYDYSPAAGNPTEKLNESDDEFEFDIVCRNPNSVTADEIVPRYPLFDRSLLDDDKSYPNNSAPEKVHRNPLGKLFREERGEPASCSSSEADNLDGITPGTYCIWKPKVESPEKCTKSNSTGNSSRRWRFRSLLRRTNSDSHMAAGKDAGFSPVTAAKVKKVDSTAKVAGADDDGEPIPVTEINRAKKTKTRSYFRYKKDQLRI
ncbi:hypothetical protein SSX86_000257 [Deinandra increscens subsp. villosa]|uniref:Uncharacterized protein n=1 Tax=Deinandra increscens subsp. villosa TaxID=3103831 RepID=A0AAP0E0D9_9ASTR